MPFLGHKSLKSLFEHQHILEVMAGWGRNVKTIKEVNPEEITLVDINPLSINLAETEFKDDSTIKPICADLNEWIKKPHHKYTGIIGVWTLSYMDGK